MESFAGALHEVVETLGLENPIVMGHSMGGHIGLVYALAHPGSLGALVLASPAGLEAFSARERAWLAQAVRSELFVAATEEDIWGSVRALNFARWRRELSWLIEERVRVARTPEFRSYAYANALSVRGLSFTDLVRQNLGEIDVPVLIVYGGDDALIPNPFLHGGRTGDIMEFGHGGIPGSKIVPLAGCGHSVQLDCPASFNAAVEAFLASPH